jgi:hypothetical protein
METAAAATTETVAANMEVVVSTEAAVSTAAAANMEAVVNTEAAAATTNVVVNMIATGRNHVHVAAATIPAAVTEVTDADGSQIETTKIATSVTAARRVVLAKRGTGVVVTVVAAAVTARAIMVSAVPVRVAAIMVKAEVTTAVRVTTAKATTSSRVVTRIVTIIQQASARDVHTKIRATTVAVTTVGTVAAKKVRAAAKVATIAGRNAAGGIALQTRLLRGLAMKKPNAGAAWTSVVDVDQRTIAALTNAFAKTSTIDSARTITSMRLKSL